MTDPAPSERRVARAALPAYGLGGADLELISVSENSTFRVGHPDHPSSVLRVHRPGYHSERAIRSELAWIAALRDARVVQTPAWIPALDGSALVRVEGPDGPRHVVRFAWVDGVEPAGERLVGDFARLGAIAARLHAHVRTWLPPTDFTRFVWDAGAILGEGCRWGRWRDGLGVGAQELSILTRAAERLRHHLAAYGTSPDRFSLVHADMRQANLLVDDDRVSLIDFDDCGFSWLMYDFAAAVSFIEDDPRLPELADAWLTGYRGVGALSADDVGVLPTLVMARRLLLLAWISSHRTTATARAMGERFTAGTCELAERYLGGNLLEQSRSERVRLR